MSSRIKRAVDLMRHVPSGQEVYHGVEVGTLVGAFAIALLNHVPRLVLTVVDSWRDNPVGREHAYENLRPYRDRVEIIDADSLEAAAQLRREGRLFDFVYIDAGHEEYECAADIKAWSPLVKPGGVLGGHDFGHPTFPGVKVAVKKFARKGGLEIARGYDHQWFTKL